VDGALAPGATAKDLILAIIACIGNAGAAGHIVEYAGAAIRNLSMEGRMTVCNMSAEAGARAGLIASDQTTFDYLAACTNVATGAGWYAALADWQGLTSDDGARFDREIQFDSGDVAPLGHQPGGIGAGEWSCAGAGCSGRYWPAPAHGGSARL